jgi:cytochrome c oxidase assembly protein subunit 15
VSVAHAGLAQIFLCLTVLLALATSPAWLSPAAVQPALVPVAGAAAVATGATYLQILLGAVMRHLGAGLAIPDFPLVFGGLWPSHWSAAIAAHYAHRVGALVVTALVITAVVRVFRAREAAAFLRLPSLAWLVVLGGQVTLGSAVVLSQRAVVPNTAHVATGALLLALGWVVTLGAWRLRHAAKVARRFESPAAVREAVA